MILLIKAGAFSLRFYTSCYTVSTLSLAIVFPVACLVLHRHILLFPQSGPSRASSSGLARYLGYMLSSRMALPSNTINHSFVQTRALQPMIWSCSAAFLMLKSDQLKRSQQLVSLHFSANLLPLRLRTMDSIEIVVFWLVFGNQRTVPRLMLRILPVWCSLFQRGTVETSLHCVQKNEIQSQNDISKLTPHKQVGLDWIAVNVFIIVALVPSDRKHLQLCRGSSRQQLECPWQVTVFVLPRWSHIQLGRPKSVCLWLLEQSRHQIDK